MSSELENAGTGETPSDSAVVESEEFRLSLDVEISDAGPCKKHVRVTVSRSDIDALRSQAVNELSDSAQVPGFRVGHVPRRLLERKFKSEITDQIKQKVLVGSLEQLSEKNDIDPINEPNLDIEDLEIPDDEDFEYEFDVEVRPEFELPDYSGLEIKRPTGEVTDEDVERYKRRYLAQYGEKTETDSPAEPDDHVTADISVTRDGEKVASASGLSIQIRPTLHFHDAEITGFDKLMTGVVPGDTREVDVQVSLEAPNIEMRGETVPVSLAVTSVRRLQLPEQNRDFFDRIGVDSEEDLTNNIRETLERQITYQQRQATRQQVLEKITESADWDLPEELVLRQAENALRRETLEMQQAGFTPQQVQARENEMRQNAVSTTRQALKEHFVLDKIATKENIEATPADVDGEILLMAMQSGESSRRVRARLQKTGLIENLEAQIRERKAVDWVLQQAEFKDIAMGPAADDSVQAVSFSVCGEAAAVDDEADGDEAADGE